MSDGKREEVQQNMKEYLERTYEKEFVVEKPVLKGNEGFGYKTYVAKAYPKEDRSLQFYAAWDIGEPGYYDDDYLKVLWSRQGTEELTGVLEGIYGEGNVIVEYELSYNNRKFKDCNYVEAIQKSKGNAFIDINYYVFSNNDIDKQKEAENIFKIYKQYILDYNTKMYFFNVDYVLKECKDEYDEILKDLNYDYDQLYQEGKIFNLLHLDDLSPADNSQGVLNKFKY